MLHQYLSHAVPLLYDTLPQVGSAHFRESPRETPCVLCCHHGRFPLGSWQLHYFVCSVLFWASLMGAELLTLKICESSTLKEGSFSTISSATLVFSTVSMKQMSSRHYQC